jgi:AcrR family transcriptional regulator
MSADGTTQTLREAHKDLTRGRILEAALRLLKAGAADSLTIAGVAAEAGVTERTIYRHFATREDLIGAVWEKVNEDIPGPLVPKTPEELIAQPRHTFPQFDVDEALVRAVITTRQGQEMRLSVNDVRQAAVRKAVRMARPDLEEPHFTRLCAVVQLLDSASCWVVLKDFWGLDGGEAGKAASQAIAVLLKAAPDFVPARDEDEEDKS